MNITYDDNYIYVVGAQVEVRNYLTAHMGASYSKAKDHCKLYKNTGVMNELFKKVPDIRAVPGFMDLGYSLKRNKEQLLTTRRNAETLAAIDPQLRAYQNADVHVLSQLNSAGVFNDPRTGKTPTVVTALKVAGGKRNLIVVPASLLWNWHKEITKWVPGAAVEVIEKSAKFPMQWAAFMAPKKVQSFMIISKNMLPNVILDMGTTMFDAAVVDEAHFLRNYSTNQSKAVFKIKAKRRYALTGTPATRHPSDVFGILKFLYPKRYSSYWTFVDRYFEKSDSFFSDSPKVGNLRTDRAKELQEEVGLVSINRKRSEVMDWLPAKEYEEVVTPMGTAQQKAYTDMKNKFTHTSEDGTELDAQNIITQLMRLRRLAIDPRIEGLRTVGTKTHLLFQWLEDNDKPTSVIMSMFTSYLKILQADLTKKGYTVGMVTGEETAQEKRDTVARFQAGEINILLCNTISAGTGWTLDTADTVIFVDNAWTPADQQQAEDRVTPTTPDRVHRHRVVNLITVGSVDEWMFEGLKLKKSMTDLINEGGREALMRLL